MTEDNVKKLAHLINLNIKEGEMRNDIQNPQYQFLYFDIFFDDLKGKKDGPSTYESFREQLIQQLNIDEKRSEEAVESFMTVWNAWVALYSELKKRNWIAAV